MDTPITASFQWTREEFLLSQQISIRYSPIGRKLSRGKTITVGSMALLTGLILLGRGNLVGLVALLPGTILLLFPWFVRRAIRKHYARRPDRDMKVNWEFYPDCLHSETEASSGDLAWRMIDRIVKTPKGFLLFPNDRIYHWVPMHAFRDAGDIERFSELAKSRVQKYTDESEAKLKKLFSF